MMLSVITLLINKYFISADIQLKRNNYFVGDKINFNIVLKNKAILPIFFATVKSHVLNMVNNDYSGEIVSLGGKAKKDLEYETCFQQRGIYNLGDMQVEIEDLALIASIGKDMRINCNVNIYPCIHAVRFEEFSSFNDFNGVKINSSGVEDPYTVRENRKYFPGDNLKKINWKISAKSSELYVKSDDRISGNDFNVFIDMHKSNYANGNKDEESLVELCVSLLDRFSKSKISTKVFINNRENKILSMMDNKDFNVIMDYFLYNRSEGTREFVPYLKINFTENSHIYNAVFIVNVISEELVKYIMDISCRRKHIFIFYNYIYDETIEKTIKKKLIKCGIALFKIQSMIN